MDFEAIRESDNEPMTPGKTKGLQALADKRGVIAALAIDQRSALRKMFAAASGRRAEAVPVEWLVEFKEKVSKILTPHASAILLDPEYGLPAARVRHADAGLLLAYEVSGYDKSIPGRLPRTIEGKTVQSLKADGADAVKVLLYYSPFSDERINTQKQAWVKGVGKKCAAADLPFFLEIVSYRDDLDEKSAEFAKVKPEAVTRSVEEFCRPEYGVDVLKVGVPVNMKFVESATLPLSQALYSRKQAMEHFRRASDAATLPFIYLSEGVSNEMFVDALKLAAEAGSNFSGVLCGRATWQDGVGIFVQKGAAALEDWLGETGTCNIENVNAHLGPARPWHQQMSRTADGKGR